MSDDPALEPPSISYIPTEGSVVGCEAGTMISQDEAFSRALSAMYWGGYWTAMYHVRDFSSLFVPFTNLSCSVRDNVLGM